MGRGGSARRKSTGGAAPALAALLWALPGTASETLCPGIDIRVTTQDVGLAGRTCRAAGAAIETFAACGHSLDTGLSITILDRLDPVCLGLFHCGTDRIEVLSPAAIATTRRPDGIFAHVPAERMFDSIVLHEMTHALYDGTPCPFRHCVATSEYLAYAFQIDALSPEDRAPIAARMDLAQPVKRDAINAMLLMLAPDRFALNAWAHLEQRADRCAWIDGILQGGIVFDHALP
ncbi:DUF6639 family protein [Pseudoponticoccus marisrubri]|uniref:Uncharacterized protein n=1 Tax=Pseudoponticoccus marisrubri TaxID=1685382 RepID=A0A0W7WLU5_9RHOB|nr:DUF6639 family protein [Pseudoponticoccus marisrubri]KUF11557.1 hypothetical protein AVJ23_07300 [Pseudoponticoccus marisrubri]